MEAYGYYALLLLLAGLAILMAEVFIPSSGLLFCTTVIILAGSVWCAYAAWWQSNPPVFWLFCASILVLVPAVLIAAFTLLPRTKFGKRILLEAPDLNKLTPFTKESAKLEQLIGQRGHTKTLLNPGGIIEIHGERYHGFTEGLLLEPGVEVEIVEVRGTRLLVRVPIPVDSSTPSSTNHSSHGVTTEPSPLDFEIPGS